MKDCIHIDQTVFQLDFKGHLKDFSTWTPQLMEWFAGQEQIELSREHREIIRFIREFFEKKKVHPVVRIVSAHMTDIFGNDRGTVKFFHTLFPKGIHQAYRIAGLPPLVLSV